MEIASVALAQFCLQVDKQTDRQTNHTDILTSSVEVMLLSNGTCG